MNNFTAILILLLIYTLGVFSGVLGLIKTNKYSRGPFLIEKCEVDLPRNQHCILYAKPEDLK